MPENDFNPEDYPGLNLAYEFVEPSYSWMLGRLDASENRIQRILVFAATITFAAPVFLASLTPDKEIGVGWYYAALAIFALIIVGGIVGRFVGKTKLASPWEMYEKHLHREPADFKRTMLYHAGDAFENNVRVVNTRGNLSLAMTIALGAEVLLFVLGWLTANPV